MPVCTDKTYFFAFAVVTLIIKKLAPNPIVSFPQKRQTIIFRTQSLFICLTIIFTRKYGNKCSSKKIVAFKIIYQEIFTERQVQ